MDVDSESDEDDFIDDDEDDRPKKGRKAAPQKAPAKKAPAKATPKKSAAQKAAPAAATKKAVSDDVEKKPAKPKFECVPKHQRMLCPDVLTRFTRSRCTVLEHMPHVQPLDRRTRVPRKSQRANRTACPV
jgi:chromatin remodeling complex protein RSC6